MILCYHGPQNLCLRNVSFVQICDFVRTENIKSLIEYIVTKHLSTPATPQDKSLEDIANSHVDTFKQLRKKHEENNPPAAATSLEAAVPPSNEVNADDSHNILNGAARPMLNPKAIEDQVSFWPIIISVALRSIADNSLP